MTSLGIAITTQERHEVLYQGLRYHWEYGPTAATFVIVDDGSEVPTAQQWLMTVHPEEYELWSPYITWVYHEQPLGVAAAKNRCIAELMAAKVDHLFLFDDDAYPNAVGWYNHFINHPEGHLQYNYPSTNDHDAILALLYDDGVTAAYNSSRGVCLYYTADVINRIGGMDTAYRFGFEHIDHSERIHNAGLTTWAHQSPATQTPNHPLIIALDESAKVEPVITAADRRYWTTPNLTLLERHKGRSNFIPYTVPQHQVLTCLYTGVHDPQAPQGVPREPWTTTDEYARMLLFSLGYSGTSAPHTWAIDYRVFHNETLVERINDPHWIQVSMATSSCNVYVQRWVHYRNYLVTHPDVEKVWIVDCSDVEYLQRPTDPFDYIEPNTLYIGYEPEITGLAWMQANHDASADWLTSHPRETLHNAGVLGADRDTALLFIHELLSAYRNAVVACKTDQAGDMGFIQQAVYALKAQGTPVITGPAITSIYKAFQHNANALWRHK